MLKLQEELLKQGRGFDFQSHGINAAGDNFYNFALYAAPGTKGSTYYIHGFDLDVITDTIKVLLMDEKDNSVKPLAPAMPIPAMPLPRG